MAKRIRQFLSPLFCSLLTLLGFTACRSSKPGANEPSPVDRLNQQIEAAEREGADVSRDIQQSQDEIQKNEKFFRDIRTRPLVYGPPPVRRK